VIDLLYNKLDAEAAKMLAEVAKQKGISLCGIQRDQTTADFSHKRFEPADKQRIEPPDAILLASDLSQAVVTGGLTSIDLSGNQLCGIWTDWRGDQHGTYTTEGIIAIANAIRVNGSLTALDLSSNCLKDEGVSAVCKAIQSNKETKLASLNFRNNGIGPVGANAVAAMVAVTGAQTKIN
jgi:Ran GTPase-activating protein (RanGAP) involved in mRNA processing and transport